MLTREAALALGPHGITVNTLSPGAVRVPPSAVKKPSMHPVGGKKILDYYNYPPGNFLSGRMGQPYDMGFLAAIIADERSAFMTGSDIRADGGAMM
jgi:glucose 1-dehydrogenase